MNTYEVLIDGMISEVTADRILLSDGCLVFLIKDNVIAAVSRDKWVSCVMNSEGEKVDETQ